MQFIRQERLKSIKQNRDYKPNDLANKKLTETRNTAQESSSTGFNLSQIESPRKKGRFFEEAKSKKFSRESMDIEN